MTAQDKLARLRFEDPAAAAAAVDGLWEQLAREEPRMFAALWRRANRPADRPAEPVTVPTVEWIDELPPMEVIAQRFPSVNLAPVPLAPLPALPTQLLPPLPAQAQPLRPAHLVADVPVAEGAWV
ncbi:MAG: hypothetical protein JJD92_15005 [Frankiaceae bacterium]|nr:hypothetical protein [Frankiaceae bacterium]